MIDSDTGTCGHLSRPASRRLRLVPEGQLVHVAAPVASVSDHSLCLTTTRLHQAESDLRAVRLALAKAKAELAKTQIREQRAHYLALHDALTALPNRRHFRQRLAVSLPSADSPRQALALLYIDLDGFKSVNDAHGHHAGDQLLQVVAARLKNSMRAEDMVCRLGGDEFGCLLAGLPNRREVSQVAAKVFDVISAPLRIGTLSLVVLPSIGIALSPGDGTTGEDLLRRADAAMYHAKHYRTGYTFFREAFPQGMALGERPVAPVR